jgi:hypothetical protein
MKVIYPMVREEAAFQHLVNCIYDLQASKCHRPALPGTLPDIARQRFPGLSPDAKNCHPIIRLFYEP